MKKLLLLTLLTPALHCMNPIQKIVQKVISKPVPLKVITAALLIQQGVVIKKAIKND